MSSLPDTIGRVAYPHLCGLIERQVRMTPQHEKFLSRRFQHSPPRELQSCEYLASLIAAIAGDDLDAFCLDYDFICQIQQEEEYYFRRHGEYRLKSFADAVRQIYSNGPYMDRYMNGLLLTQVYWSNHTASFFFFRDQYLASLPSGYRYVDVGPGHGLLAGEAARQPHAGAVHGWDLSDASIARTRTALRRMAVTTPVALTLQDLFDASGTFDGVGLSEVLEHLDRPVLALERLRDILRPGGRLFVNVPVNCPMPDHLYLLRSPEEARQVLEDAGFAIDDYGYYPATNYSMEQARKRALTISVCLIARRV